MMDIQTILNVDIDDGQEKTHADKPTCDLEKGTKVCLSEVGSETYLRDEGESCLNEEEEKCHQDCKGDERSLGAARPSSNRRLMIKS